ncbi:MAG: hypothetical protein LBR91_00730 [Puniceicoccales bacterium]|nr:hypothetical protein [Puniceicoccales bacterium]
MNNTVLRTNKSSLAVSNRYNVNDGKESDPAKLARASYTSENGCILTVEVSSNKSGIGKQILHIFVSVPLPNEKPASARICYGANFGESVNSYSVSDAVGMGKKADEEKGKNTCEILASIISENIEVYDEVAGQELRNFANKIRHSSWAKGWKHNNCAV